MTEYQINLAVADWLISQGFKYKGVNKSRKTAKHDLSVGQIPVPDGTRQVLIDHQGIKDIPIDLVWIEAKGSNVGMSNLLEGFIRMVYAVWHGGGSGLLAIPNSEYMQLLEQLPFLVSVSKSTQRYIGLFNAETLKIKWLDR